MQTLKLNNESGPLEDFYSMDYIKIHPSLHSEDSAWKVSKILPPINLFKNEINKKLIKILDVGGGAGIIFLNISNYLESQRFLIEKSALDLSRDMLNIQQKNNPGLKTYLGDISKTNFKDKSFDICLLIDVLEHLKNDHVAIKEIKRISNYALFKVPLEKNLIENIINHLLANRLNISRRKRYGHVNYYTINSLENILKVIGKIEYISFTNNSRRKIFEYKNKSIKTRIYYLFQGVLGEILNLFSPRLKAFFVFDFCIILVKCDKNPPSLHSNST